MMRLSFVEQSVGGHLIGRDASVLGVTTDSRDVRGGELFVALRGERFDGHDFVGEAFSKGAVAAMVDAQAADINSQIVVRDTEASLGVLAAKWRNEFDMPVVAVTGSNGKTTVKTMIGTILSRCGKTAVSPKNFNNAVGLPLSLLELRRSDQFAVMEIGMNQFGEIAQLSKIAQPTVAVITNAGQAHLMNLCSVEQVALEKSTIVDGLGAGGIAVINADDEHFELFQRAASGCQTITFGLHCEADVAGRCTIDGLTSILYMRTPVGEAEIRLNLPGEHNAANALAACAAAIAAGASLQNACDGIEAMRPVAGRLCLQTHCAGGELLDDSYNANPSSLAAAMRLVSSLGGDRRLVIGDMLELGGHAEKLHRKAGNEARHLGFGRLYAIGEWSRFAVEEFGRGARHYDSHSDIVADLCADISRESKVLVKGSRGMRMERVVSGLLAGSDASC